MTVEEQTPGQIQRFAGALPTEHPSQRIGLALLEKNVDFAQVIFLSLKKILRAPKLSAARTGSDTHFVGLLVEMFCSDVLI
jgi:hypothetical protein